MAYIRNILLFSLLSICTTLLGQDDDLLERYHGHIEEYQLYKKANLYPGAIEELKSAIDLCDELNLERDLIKHTIGLAEMHRVIQKFHVGLKLLEELKGTEKYPKLDIQRASRWAAIYYEVPEIPLEEKRDTLFQIYRREIVRAEKYGFPLLEADLLNQLGYLECRDDHYAEGYPKLQKAAELYRENGDLQNEMVAETNLLLYIDPFHKIKWDYVHFRQKYEELRPKFEGKGWYAIEVNIYNFMSVTYGRLGDSTEYFRFAHYAGKSNVSLMLETHSDQLAAYSILYETQEAKKQAAEQKEIATEKSLRLQDKEAQAKQLIWIVLLLVIVVLAVVVSLFRERGLKKTISRAATDLHTANENYHMLLVESNHRIKNNLQMIISMLDYEGTRTDVDGDDRLRKMSINVQTISALHKHLYADVHNQEVNLIVYLNEIVELYSELTPNNFKLDHTVDSILIGSERIVYFGLMFNEMLSNTIEHSKRTNNDITVSISKHGDAFQFLYSDGTKWETNPSNKGTGTLLIKQFVVRVKGENFQLDRTKGQYTFEFNA